MYCKVLSSHGLIKDIDSHWGTWAVQIKYNITFQAAITWQQYGERLTETCKLII